jgi:AhpD family alkylhydroperoxidase
VNLYGSSGLDRKTVELIVTALLALRGWETGVRTHAALAREAGASPEEI